MKAFVVVTSDERRATKFWLRRHFCRSLADHRLADRRLADRHFCRHLFKHKSSKTTADLIAIVARMAIFHETEINEVVEFGENKTKQTPLFFTLF